MNVKQYYSVLSKIGLARDYARQIISCEECGDDTVPGRLDICLSAAEALVALTTAYQTLTETVKPYVTGSFDDYHQQIYEEIKAEREANADG